jgi:flagellar protein FlaG
MTKMSKVVQSISASEPSLGLPARPVARESKPITPTPSAEPPSQADLRLTIEEGAEPGHYIYTIVDRRTGKVISQLPREEVLRMREREGYSAGDVFDGKA